MISLHRSSKNFVLIFKKLERELSKTRYCHCKSSALLSLPIIKAHSHHSGLTGHFSQSILYPTNKIMATQSTQISSQSKDSQAEENSPKSSASKFKILVRDYGATAVVFHVTISLFSLGVCYLLINSSIPMEKVFASFGIDQKLGNLNTTAATSTNFIVAYAVHKSLAPIRLGITGASLPFVVRFLRSKNILKPPKK